MTCCRCKSKGGRCLNCACVKAGRSFGTTANTACYCLMFIFMLVWNGGSHSTTGNELFHYNCSGITSQEEQDDWQCLQCSILQSQNTKTIRHIPKGARIQVALALAQLLEACSNESGSIAAWRGLFSFPANALAAHRYNTLRRYYIYDVANCQYHAIIMVQWNLTTLYLNRRRFPSR